MAWLNGDTIDWIETFIGRLCCFIENECMHASDPIHFYKDGIPDRNVYKDVFTDPKK
jgi:hypothetical protein